MAYTVILADPPWSYDDAACVASTAVAGGWRGTPYATLDVGGLAALPVHKLAAPDCALFMWATYPLLPEALRVISGWGFQYKSIAFQWLKLNRVQPTPFYGLGRWTRGNTEPCLLATRGRPKRVSNGVSQLLFGDGSAWAPDILHAPMQGHSAKPPEAHARICELMGDVPRIELFARRATPGWDCTGLELDGVDIRDLLATLVPEPEKKGCSSL